MEKIISYNLSENYIRRLAGLIEDNYLKQGRDISSLAFVFGGKRPALFLKKELARKIGSPFTSPRFFSMDEFVEYVVSLRVNFSKITDLDSCFIIYNLVKEIAPDILKGREGFSLFLPWGREIVSFIDQLDLEDIERPQLNTVQLSAAIGYDVPESVNALLKGIVSLRQAYRGALLERKAYHRGLLYLLASEYATHADLGEFEQIFFCNFFYLHKTEERIIRKIYEKDKAVLVFQGSQEEWPVLKRISQGLSCPISPAPLKENGRYNLSISAGFDVHSQVCLVRDILKGIKDQDSTVIVLPNPDNVIPLLSEIAAYTGECNVSLGYPLNRSPVYSLFECIVKAQETRKAEEYYARDYLRLLGHPLLKNLRLIQDEPAITRILSHKAEEVATGAQKTPLGGSLFLRLEDMENCQELYELAFAMMQGVGIQVNKGRLKELLKQLHRIFFSSWENISSFAEFISSLKELSDILMSKGFLDRYPLNLKIMERLYAFQDELTRAEFLYERFSPEDIFRIFTNKLDNEMIAFSGSPLKGLQVLGFLETRSLNFENVIIMDVNEQVLPSLKIYEPLIPREVMIHLGLNRLEKEEEIQRYQFRRLISGARNVYLVYEHSERKERSRFLEELVWERQKAKKRLEVMEIPRAAFNVRVSSENTRIKKEARVIDFLKSAVYSPSGINTYLWCPLKFYYQYVLRLSEKDSILDEPEASDVGNFIHELLEDAFGPFIGKRPFIDKGFRKYFFALMDKKFEAEFRKKMKSDAFMVREIIRFRLERFLDNEAGRPVSEVIALERKYHDTLSLAGGDIRFSARIDRIDRLSDGSILVLDYKTGSADMPGDIRAIKDTALSRELIRDTVRSFQLPLYLYFTDKLYSGLKTNAALYAIRDLEDNYGLRPLFRKEEQFAEKDEIMRLFLKALEGVFQDILNPDIPFAADKSGYSKCEYCQFRALCR